MKVAIVGSGIAGLGCAHALLAERQHGVQVTLFEAERRLGGHTNTVDVRLDGVEHPVDTGFLVFNERTYPNLIRLLAELGVPTAKSDMSFAVSVPTVGGRRIEWAGTDLAGVFAQRRNLASPRFLGMLADILRFNRQATRIAQGAEQAGEQTLGEFLDRHRYGESFRRWYLLPMAAAIWSCPMRTMLGYPLATFVRFCHNHGLLQVADRPQWFTVAGGARQYVQRIAARLTDLRLATPVLEVRRNEAAGKVSVRTARGVEAFDQVVLACHSDQSAAMLADADDTERGVLAGARYQPNRAVLHTDARLMPKLRSVWSSWNYLSDGAADPAVSVTYLLNRLQPLPFRTPVFVSLNPLVEPDPQTVIAEFEYSHPIFDARMIEAQQRLPDVQGRRRVWLAGAWTGYGFHEDGLKSGLAAAGALAALARRPQRLAA
ncbi:MAG: FAD-dependent oxidoreductase [Burkholderiales bacterium]|jgi:predicted NAD/FAD-binding protein|nr:FAD-dependent oxidoreductase [Burkholderiales bacterium]